MADNKPTCQFCWRTVLCWRFVSLSFSLSVCVRLLLSVLTYSFSEGSRLFKLPGSFVFSGKKSSMVLCGRNVPVLLEPFCLSLAFYLCLASLWLFHFSLNYSTAASFNISPVIYFCPYLAIVQSASAKLSFPLLSFFLSFRTRILWF